MTEPRKVVRPFGSLPANVAKFYSFYGHEPQARAREFFRGRRIGHYGKSVGEIVKHVMFLVRPIVMVTLEFERLEMRHTPNKVLFD
jgi:hypothetical protein